MPLYVVSTPIGNLSDMGARAVEVLRAADCVAAEDTRHSQTLFARYAISVRTMSYHDHNKYERTPELMALLRAGKTVAVISDAGTPGVADPAFHLVRSAIAENIPVLPVPGPSALLAALVASGLPTDRFVFENFLPPKEGKRQRKLESLKEEERTVVFYESPHRILKSLDTMREVFGDVPMVVARELTKKFETFYRGKISEIKAALEKQTVRGEFVVLFNLKHPVGSPEVMSGPGDDNGEDDDSDAIHE
ncbi:MAG: 16S rRNA (cytidine(1402)-2'-O)-methyltransferase [Fibrobacterota bacterium]